MNKTTNYSQHSKMLAQMLISWQRTMLRFSFGRDTNLLARYFYLKLQEFLQPDASLEVGAHEAEYSQRMRKMFPNIEIVAFEANPGVYKKFSELVPFDKININYTNEAIADKDGTIPFNVLSEPGKVLGISSLMQRELDGKTDSSVIDVPSRRGDSIPIFQTARNASLWIDVEGANESVLKSFSKTLADQKIATIFIEVENHIYWKNQWLEEQVIEYLLQNSYVPFFCDDDDATQHNTIFIRSDAVTPPLLTWAAGCYKTLGNELKRHQRGPKFLRKLKRKIYGEPNLM